MVLPETVLSNPIVPIRVNQFVDHYNGKDGFRISQATSLRKLKSAPAAVQNHRTDLNPLLWKLEVPDNEEGLDIAMSSTLKVALELASGLSDRLDGDVYGQVVESFPNATQWSNLTKLWYRRSLFWKQVVRDQFRLEGKSKDKWHTTKRYYVNRFYAVVPVSGIKFPVVLNNNMVLMIKDITHSYLATSMHLDLAGHRCDLRRKDLVFWEDWTSNCLQTMDNAGYEVIKCIEPMAKGRIIQLTETILDPDEVYEEMRRKAEERATAKPEYGSELVGRLDKHLQSISKVERISEVFCLMKMAGHPRVDVVGGGRKSRLLGQKDLKLPYSSGRAIDRSYCHLYTKGYIKNHRQWPPLLFLRREEEPASELEKLRDADFQNLPMGLSMYPAADWDNCIFLPHKSFDYGADFLALISDKSLSYLKPEFDYAWNEELPYTPPKPTTQRRVLTELLRTEEFDMEDIVRRVQARNIPDSWKIVTLSPKEREMKIDPRMFAIMPLPMRSFFVLLEKNVSDHIFPEISEQTMTDGNLETVRRFFGLSNPGSQTTKVHFEVDFTSWNILWRDETVSPVGHRIDQTFGTPGAYTFIHEFFRNSMINVRVDGHIPPGLNAENREHPPESNLLWRNHLGGFEGIGQKPWTGCTEAMIHHALWKLGLDYTVSGQGDNQVITITVRYPRNLTNETDKILFVRKLMRTVKERLKKICLRFGHIVKPEECIQSTSYLSYSKNMWANGACLPTSIKSISRLFPTTSSDCPSLTEMVAGLTSGGLAASERSTDSMMHYWITLAQISLLFYGELKTSLLHGKTLGEIVSFNQLTTTGMQRVCTALSIIPLEAGGFPVPSWLEFMYRGVPDPLTSAITWMEILQGIPLVGSWLSLLDPGVGSKSKLTDSNPKPERLIQDPFSIPLTRPGDPKSLTANMVRDNLLDIAKNKEIRAMLHATDESDKDLLAEWLKQLKPVYPKIWHDIYNLSPTGVVDKFSKRFTSTKTILGVGVMAGVDVQRVSIQYDLNYSSWIMRRVKEAAVTAVPAFRRGGNGSSFTSASRLREEWGLGPLEGVTTIHPFDLGTISSRAIKTSSCPSLIAAAVSTECSSLFKERGPFDPYLGSSTRVKTAYKGAQIMNSSPPVRDAIRLLEIRNWITKEGDPAWDGLTKVAQTRLTFDVQDLAPFVPPVIGGTLTHRYNMSDAETGAYLSCLPNVASNIALSSNKSGEIGEKDYPVMFQTLYLTLISLICCCWSRGEKSSSTNVQTCYIIPNLKAFSEISEGRMVYEGDKQPIKTYPANSFYLTGRSIDIPSRSMKSAKMATRETFRTIESFPESPVGPAVQYLIRQWAKRVPTPIQLGGLSWSAETPGKIVDMPEITRITDEGFLTAMTNAILDLTKQSRMYKETQTEWEGRYAEALEKKALEISPGALATFNQTAKTRTTSGLGRLSGIEGAIRLTSMVKQRWKALANDTTVWIYDCDSESIASSTLVLFGRVITKLNLIGSKDALKVATNLNKLLSAVRVLSQDEYNLQSNLWKAICSIPSLRNNFKVSREYASVIVRELRKEDPIDESDINKEFFGEEWDNAVNRMIRTPCGKCRPGGRELLLSGSESRLEESEIQNGWRNRRLLGLGSGLYNWLPLRGIINRIGTVHIIGAGDASIDLVFPDGVHRLYYDTRSSTIRRGQEFTDSPARRNKDSNLHPSSWSGEVDITNDIFLKEMVACCKDLDCVVIDVDRVSMMDRVKSRDWISSQMVGCMVLVRIAGTADEIESIIGGVCSTGGKDTVWWRSQVHPANEVIVGNNSGRRICSVIKLGLNGACDECDIVELDGLVPELVEQEGVYLEVSVRLAQKRARLARRDPSRGEKRREITRNEIKRKQEIEDDWNAWYD